MLTLSQIYCVHLIVNRCWLIHALKRPGKLDWSILFNHLSTQSLVFWIAVAFSYTCSCRIHTEAMNNRRRKTSLTKYLPLILLQGFEKGYSRFACERELETEQKLKYFAPTLMAVKVVSFSFSCCSTGGPGVHSVGCWLSLQHLISNSSGPQTPSGFPRAPSAGCGFPYHNSSITPSDL